MVTDHIILLDWQMPGGMDGLATAKAVRHELKDSQNPIIIMVTAFDRDDLLAQTDSYLMDAVLTKPLTASSLYNAVANVLKLRHGNESPLPNAQQQRLVGLSIQVVDDSDINREVAQRIFSGEGAHVVLANDGRQAVEWLQAHPNEVDIVLMDVQMPFMNGYEATKEIRCVPALAELPVVALTASNFIEIQSLASEAGMNGFIAKPFDVDVAIELIIKLTGGIYTVVTPPKFPLPSDHDLPGLSLGRGLAIWKDPLAYRQYLHKFVREYTDIVSKMGSLESAESASLAHKLKGAAGSLALDEVSMLAGEIVQRLCAHEDSTNGLLRLQTALETALESIGQYAPPDDPSENIVSDLFDYDQVAALLAQLLVACNTDNRNEVRPVLAKLDKLLPQTRLAAIHSELEDFNLRGVEAATRSLAYALNILLEE